MRVFFWASDTGGSAWYRMYLPAASLSWLGHEVATNNKLVNNWDSCDTIVGARTCQAHTSVIWERMAHQGKRLVIDLDDDYFHMDPRIHPPEHIEEWAGYLPQLVKNMNISDAVTVASEGIAEIIRNETDTPVVVIPNGLPAQFLGLHREYHKQHVLVGWAGSGSTMPEVTTIRHALRKATMLSTKTLQVEVGLVGPDPRDPAVHGLGDFGVRTTGYIPRQEDYLHTCSLFDIWVAPYRDIPFNQAKFPTKSLEAGFLGVPLVASATRPYEETIDHGVTGFLVRNDHEWTRYIRKLVNDPDLRQTMGMNARLAASRSTMQNLNKQWEEVLQP